MTSWGIATPREEPPARRVREQVKDAITACACTLGASTLVALALSLVGKLAG